MSCYAGSTTACAYCSIADWISVPDSPWIRICFLIHTLNSHKFCFSYNEVIQRYSKNVAVHRYLWDMLLFFDSVTRTGWGGTMQLVFQVSRDPNMSPNDNTCTKSTLKFLPQIAQKNNVHTPIVSFDKQNSRLSVCTPKSFNGASCNEGLETGTWTHWIIQISIYFAFIIVGFGVQFVPLRPVSCSDKWPIW